MTVEVIASAIAQSKLDCCDWHASVQKELAAEINAALTAAAKVGYQKWEVGDYDPHRHARHAAVEVEGEGWARRDERRTVAAERERCAQVAEQWVKRPISANEIARAIRKGEKP